MAGPRSSAQRPKPSKASKNASKKQFSDTDGDKSAYRAMKGAGGGTFRSAKERIAARRLAKKSAKTSFQQKKGSGSSEYTGKAVVPGVSEADIKRNLEGGRATK